MGQREWAFRRGRHRKGPKHQTGRGSELGLTSCVEAQQEGGRRDRVWTAAAREHRMFKEDLQAFMNIGGCNPFLLICNKSVKTYLVPTPMTYYAMSDQKKK